MTFDPVCIHYNCGLLAESACTVWGKVLTFGKILSTDWQHHGWIIIWWVLNKNRCQKIQTIPLSVNLLSRYSSKGKRKQDNLGIFKMLCILQHCSICSICPLKFCRWLQWREWLSTPSWTVSHLGRRTKNLRVIGPSMVPSPLTKSASLTALLGLWSWGTCLLSSHPERRFSSLFPVIHAYWCAQPMTLVDMQLV